jgi:oligopeptide/dipeptide ABC transporter ATP-binding protein
MHPRNRRRGTRRPLAGDIPSALHPPPGCRFHTRCPLAIDACRVIEPPMTEPAPGHFVACHVMG